MLFSLATRWRPGAYGLLHNIGARGLLIGESGGVPMSLGGGTSGGGGRNNLGKPPGGPPGIRLIGSSSEIYNQEVKQSGLLYFI